MNTPTARTRRLAAAAIAGVLTVGLYAGVADAATGPVPGETTADHPEYGHVCSTEARDRIFDRYDRAVTNGGLNPEDAEDMKKRHQDNCNTLNPADGRWRQDEEKTQRVEKLISRLRRPTPDLGDPNVREHAETWTRITAARIVELWEGIREELQTLIPLPKIQWILNHTPAAPGGSTSRIQ